MVSATKFRTPNTQTLRATLPNFVPLGRLGARNLCTPDLKAVRMTLLRGGGNKRSVVSFHQPQ